MLAIINSWMESLRLLKISKLVLYVSTVKGCFFRAAKTLIKIFWWLFLLDLILFWFIGDSLITATKLDVSTPDKINPALLLPSILFGIIWFVINTSFLLLIRRTIVGDDVVSYLKVYFLKYAQLAIFFSFVLLMCINLLIGFGVVKFPNIHWIIISVLKFVELLTIFYWLNSEFYFRDIFKSLEKGVNILLYNLPIFTLILILMWLTDTLIKFAVMNNDSALNIVKNAVSKGVSANAMSDIKNNIHPVRFVIFKYARFINEFIWISFIYGIYNLKRSICYTKSFFE
jgi:hypothetical protein